MATIPKNKKHNKTGKKIREYNKGRVFTILYLLIILISFFKVYPYIFDKKLNLNGDNANYYVLGAALSQGKGYTMISSPSNPPENHYPPGYPVIVATVMSIFSTQIDAIKQANGFFLLLSIIALFYLFYKIIDNIHISFIATLFILLNKNILEYSTIMMSEISFLFFSILCLILVTQIDEKIAFFKNWKFLLLILLVSISYYIRSAGLALVGGIVLVYLLNKNWKYLLAFISGFVLLALPWYIRGSRLGGNSYIKSLFWKNPYRTELGRADLGDWALRVYNNFMRYLTHEIPNATINSVNLKQGTPADWQHWIIGIALVGCIIFGLIKLKKYQFVIFSYLLGTFGIMLLWPEVWFGPRFILPIVPLLVFLIIVGIYNLLLMGSRYLKLKSSFTQAVVLPLLFLAFLPLYTPSIHAMHKNAKNVYPKNYQNYFDLAKWANKNTPEDAIFACRKTAFFYLFSSRKAIGYAHSLDREKVIEQLINNNIDYVVLDQLGYSSTGLYLLPAIKRYGEKFKLVQKTKKPEAYLFEFKPDLGYWGEWKDDKRSGQGIYNWGNGLKYEGQWEDDKRNGEGTLYLANGNQLTGTWKDDKMNGRFILKSKDGAIIEQAIYADNKKTRTISPR